MPFNGSGTYSAPSLPGSWNPAASGQDATPDDWNTLLADLSLALSTCLTTDGQSTISANIPMSGFKFTGVGDATTRTQYTSMRQYQDGSGVFAVPSGTANALVIALSPPIATAVVGQRFRIKMGAGPNTDAVTLNFGPGAGPVVWPNGVPLVNSDIPGNAMFDVEVADISTPAAPVCHLQTVSVPPSMGAPTPPQGRLTLVTGTPVMTTSQAAKTTIFYAPYCGSRIPIYNGTAFAMTFFTELSNLTTASSVGSAGPAAVANNSNYDLFVWVNAGVPTLTRGPLWTSDTARGTGAGTTELERLNGIITNKVAITNGPAANRGTYVGTVRSNGTATIDVIFGAIAANGTAAVLGVWNAYNRVDVTGLVGDSTDSWPYSTSTWRSAHASDTMRVSLVSGLAEDSFSARYAAPITNTGGNSNAVVGVGVDSTSSASGTKVIDTCTDGAFGNPFGDYVGQPLGFHFYQAVEFCQFNTGTNSFLGDGGAAADIQGGLTYEWKY